MSKIAIILLIIYTIGVIISLFVFKKYLPYKEGECRIEFDGMHPVTEDMHDDDNIIRAIIWPLIVAFLIALSPILILKHLYNKL
jgi:hypothetical protein